MADCGHGCCDDTDEHEHFLAPETCPRCQMDRTTECVFCERIWAGEYEHEWLDGRVLAFASRDRHAVGFPPLRPVTPGHMLIVPFTHVETASDSPAVAGATMEAAAMYAGEIGGDCNIITSIGPAATQTIRHLHLHVVPRRDGDGLHLPWTGQ